MAGASAADPASVERAPVAESDRIDSLDTLRGFALLGILLLNILGMGLSSASYFYPLAGGTPSHADLVTWAVIDIGFEGAMRALFSMLFGAGIVLFATGVRARGGAVFYRRNAWLLIFGLVDAYVLLWTGDILVAYAVAGFFLYLARNLAPRTLLILAGVLIVLMSLNHLGTGYGLGMARDAATAVAAGEATEAERELALVWEDFAQTYVPTQEKVEREFADRRAGYVSAATWTAKELEGYFLFVLPTILIWDALAMMLIGMALYKLGVLDGSRSRVFYLRMMVGGFVVGLIVNGFEVQRAIAADFEFLATFPFAQWTYHFGRLGMAFGWLGLVMLVCQAGVLPALRRALSAAGRLALTNYLMQSVFALVLFTGAGFALVGELDRWMLYLVVLAIWVLQLGFSLWWLARYRFGPVEWVWRWLTYGRAPAITR